nr:hypothetical protein CFP56_20429 [Quercus suber]
MAGQPPQPGKQALSFKTVPGRNKTQKWQQAKTYNYDGDDWGGYDPYDEYGHNAASREATQPQYPPPPRSRRAPSFDNGDERRAFSGPSMYGDSFHSNPTISAVDSENREGNSDRLAFPVARPRDFTNPEQVPHPLSTRPPTGGTGNFPPRKSSISGSTSSSAVDASLIPSATTTKSDKPLPFIRPADIYKRMAEERERERQSTESSRPSTESVQRENLSPHSGAMLVARGSTDSLPSSMSGGRPSLNPVAEGGEAAVAQQPPQQAASLAPVHEHSGSKGSEFGPPIDPQTASRIDASPSIIGGPSPILPPVSRISGFGSDFMGGFMPATTNSGHAEQPQTSFQNTMDRVFSSPVVATSRTDSVGLGHGHEAPSITPASYAVAGDNLAEKQVTAHADFGQRSVDTNLQHQPSVGYRSAVNKAFDRADDSSVPPTPISRDNSQSMGSTSDISPIMSRVPSAAAATQRRHDHESRVSTIAEESPRAHSQTNASRITSLERKPSPSHSRSVSGASGLADVPAGFRRSLDPPSSDNSPARTPAIQDSTDRRLSEPMTAETLVHTEAPDAQDQTAEISTASLHFVGAQSPGPSHSPERAIEEYTKALPVTGRGRSGTNYSLREADLANAVNATTEHEPWFSPIAAEAKKESEQQFLRDHASSSLGPILPTAISTSGLGITQGALPFNPPSGRSSPAKGRVREIADRYHELEASRRYSQGSLVSNKSSWSNFRGSEENLSLKRKGTDASQLVDDEHSKDGTLPTTIAGDRGLHIPAEQRPGLHTQQSFVPHLPGEWISAAPTPAYETPPTVSDQSTTISSEGIHGVHTTGDEEIDLTPTTKKSPLQAVSPTMDSSSPSSALQQVKDIGAALGASLMSTAGLTSQSRDFASKEPAPPVQHPEMETRTATGEVFTNLQPPLRRYDSEAASSVADSVPPSPPVKNSGIDRGLQSMTGYFNEPQRKDLQSSQGPNERPTAVSMLSTDTGSSDYESDRLRQEIIQSLDPAKREAMKSGSITEGTETGHVAQDATHNVYLPPDSQHDGQQPAMLNQRFSWEQQKSDKHHADAKDDAAHHAKGLSISPAIPIESDQHPEVLPEMPYERPKNKALHIMNPNRSGDELESPINQPQLGAATAINQARRVVDPAVPAIVAPMSPVSPLTPEHESLAPSQFNLHSGAGQPGALHHLDPLPVSERPGSSVSSIRLPSYYTSGPTAELAGLAAVQTPDESAVEAEAPSMNEVATRPAAGQRIPPFREILAIKSSEQRIEAYKDTRETFAHIDTGLSNWLSTMLAQNPQHASLSTAPQGGYPAPALQGSTPTRHKASPSILKFTKHLVEGGDRKTSGDEATGTPIASSSNISGDNSLTADMEKMQQRGKDLMKSAGVFGGKAQAGAKGLFAKGKSRFGTLKRDGGDGGGGKAFSHSSSRSVSQDRVPAHVSTSATPISVAASTDASDIENVGQDAQEARIADDARPSPSPLPSNIQLTNVPGTDQGGALANTDSGRLNTEAGAGRESDLAADVLSKPGLKNDQLLISAHDKAAGPETPNDRIGVSNATGTGTTAIEAQETAVNPETPSSPAQIDTGTANTTDQASRSLHPEPIAGSVIPNTSSAASLDRSVPPPNLSSVGSSNTNTVSTPGTPIRVLREYERSPSPAHNKRQSKSQSFFSKPFSMFRSRKSSAPSNLLIRPTSLTVADTDNFILSKEMDITTQTLLLESSTRSVHTSCSPPQRVESWNEPDVDIPQKLEENTQGAPMTPTMPERLGVLPSPAIDSFSMRNNSPSRQFMGGIETLPETEGSHYAEEKDEHEIQPSDSSPHNSAQFVTPPATRDGTGPSLPSSPASTSIPLPTKRPSHQRKKSAIAELPSQRRAASQTHISPMYLFAQPDPVGHDDTEGDNLDFEQANLSLTQDPDMEEDLHGSSMLPSMHDRLPNQSEQVYTQGTDVCHSVTSDEPLVTTRPSMGFHVDGTISSEDMPLLTDAEQAQLPPPQMTSLGEAAALQSAFHSPLGLKKFDDWEVISAVSADDIGNEASLEVPRMEEGDIDSRHSSVSSLGEPDPHSAAETDKQNSSVALPVTSYEAVPADYPNTVTSPNGLPSALGASQISPMRPTTSDRKFMGLPYKWVSSKKSARPSSSTQSPIHISKSLPQESLDSGSGALSALENTKLSEEAATQPQLGLSYVTLSTTSTNPESTASPNIVDLPPSVHQERKLDGRAGDRRSRRFSGFFKQSDRAETPSEVIPDVPSAPPPHQIDANFDGLHGLETSGPEAMLTGEPVERPQSTHDRQGKRRSGIWDSLRRPSVSRLQYDRSNTSVVDPPNVPIAVPRAPEVVEPPVENSLGHKTLRKPQRAASSAVAPSDSTNTPTADSRNTRRFSGLGSLFGRSKTSAGHKPSKSNKLTKMPEAGRQEGTSKQVHAPGESLRGYDAYEAMRRQQNPVSQTRRVSEPVEMSYQPAGPRRAVTSEDAAPPTSTEWPVPQGARQRPFAPAQHLQGMGSPQASQAPPFKRLYSGGGRGRREALHSDVPEAFQPVEASYGRPVVPIRPPPGHQPPFSAPPNSTGILGFSPQVHPTLPTQQPYWAQPRQVSNHVPMIAPPRVRQSSPSVSSTPTNMSQFQDFDWRPTGSTPSTSPMHSRRGSGHMPPAPPQHERTGSFHEEIARSPARDYPDQQTPWSITLPGPDGAEHMQQRPLASRGPEHRLPSPQNRHSYSRYASGPPNLPSSPQSPESYVPSGMPATGNRRQYAHQGPAVMTDMSNMDGPYTPTSPYSAELPLPHRHHSAALPPSSDYYPPGPPPSQQQIRYYSNHQGLSGGHQRFAEPPTHPRSSSGYSGRRDDAALGEEQLLMRGTSYPGQEWSPTGHTPQHTWD